MSDMIEDRLKENNLKFRYENIQYKNAGHSISGNPDAISTVRKGEIIINGKTYEFAFGGTPEGDNQAQVDAKRRVLAFLSNIKSLQN